MGTISEDSLQLFRTVAAFAQNAGVDRREESSAARVLRERGYDNRLADNTDDLRHALLDRVLPLGVSRG